MTPLEQACHDILHKNLSYSNEKVYLLYDTESPLACRLFTAYKKIVPGGATIREFVHPPQPLYRGGLINPDNPHLKEQNRIITAHNISENIKVGLDHHISLTVTTAETIDPQVESIKNDLLSLPPGSIVILIQSTNFRLSTFRIRLELFHRGVHVIEFNHLAYISEDEFETFENSLSYHTPEYIRQEHILASYINMGFTPRIISSEGHELEYGALEKVRGNTGDYTQTVNKGGTFPIGEIFTEAVDLESVNGQALVEAYPGDMFEVVHVDQPFSITIERGRVLPSPLFPPLFQKIYNLILEFEGEVMVRELGMGLNKAITTTTPLSDINFYERKIGVHLSLGKKHGIYGKKLPKDMLQRYHIDVFLALDKVYMEDILIFAKGNWVL